MARQEMFVDLQKLKLVIDQLEDEQIAKGAPAHRPFRSRSELYKAIASSDWGQSIGLSSVVAAMRIDRYGIECKTVVRTRATTVAPVTASIASVVPTTPIALENASEAEPDAVPAAMIPVAPVSLRRRSMYRGIDLEAFIAPFMERGIDVDGLNSIMTSGLHTKNTNLKIQAAWHDLRERFNIPRVKDKPLEVGSVLPLDQVRLPGDIPVGESVSEAVGGLPTDEELAAEELQASEEFDLNPEPVDVVDSGWAEELYNEESREFYDPATDERTLDHIQESLDEINQEDESVADQGFRTDLLPPLSEILAANNGELPSEVVQSGEYQTAQEPLQDVFQGTEDVYQGEYQGDHLTTGELPLDEPQEVYPEREDPRDVDQELEEWLAAGETYQSGDLDTRTDNPPLEEVATELSPVLQNGDVETDANIEDEYLPLDMEEDTEPAVYDPNFVPAEFESEDFEGSGIEVEETDPNETR